MLTKTLIRKSLKDGLTGFIKENGFKWKGDRFSRTVDDDKQYFTFDISTIGHFHASKALLHINKVETTLHPILEKHGIRYLNDEYTIRDARDFLNGFYHLYKWEDMEQPVVEIADYLNNHALDFWEKYRDLGNVLELINEVEQNQITGFFQGAEGAFRKIVISKLCDDPKYEERKERYLRGLNTSADWSIAYKNYPFAFSDLIISLESSVSADL